MNTLCSEAPCIAVLMGVVCRRDRIGLLKRSVESILGQSFADFELLICDDGSDIEALAFLDGVSAADPRVRLLRPGGRTDLASKLNICLRAATGRYIARMDDDDYSVPDRFQKQRAFLDARQDVAFVGSNVTLRCGGEQCGEWVFPERPQLRDFYITQPYVHPTLMFRKACLDAVGGYSEDPRQLLCEDYDLLLRLYARGCTGANLQENLLEYSIPATAKGNRTMRHRWNETATRWARFRELGALPGALPYVVKPLAVGLLPERVLSRIKNKKRGTQK